MVSAIKNRKEEYLTRSCIASLRKDLLPEKSMNYDELDVDFEEDNYGYFIWIKMGEENEEK